MRGRHSVTRMDVDVPNGMTNSDKQERGKHVFLSPSGMRAQHCRSSPGHYETPVRSKRLMRICEGEVYSPHDHQVAVTPGGVCPPLPRLLPVHTTPPSKLTNFVAMNPFDRSLREKLHLPLVSPSLFAQAVHPSQESLEFTWSVDDVSSLRPAVIDEFQVQHDETMDSDGEREVQERIDRFFETDFFVESPWGPVNTIGSLSLDSGDNPSTPIKGAACTPPGLACCVDYSPVTLAAGREVCTQTELTFPIDIPVTVQLVLTSCALPSMDVPSSHTQVCDNMWRSRAMSPSWSSQSPRGRPVCSRNFGTPINPCSLLSPVGVSPITHTLRDMCMAGPSLSHAATQTDVTFPLLLPEPLRVSLEVYRTFTEEHPDLDSSFIRRRKLFQEHSGC